MRIVDLLTRTVSATPFLNIPNVDTRGEGGLTAIAFDPDYASNGFVYTMHTAVGDGSSPMVSHVRRYRVLPGNPDQVSPLFTRVLSFDQPQTNHNGGWLGFGPVDGLLYITTGDGGGANDTGIGHTPGIGNAQDLTDNLLGKVLRIDVRSDDFPGDATRNYAIPASNPFVGVDGDDEIWA